MKLADLPPRVLLAVAVTVLAVVVLAAQTVLSDRGGDAGPTTSTTAVEVPDEGAGAPEETEATLPPPVEVQPEWYPKRSSRYSDRSPEASVTTVPIPSGG